MRNSVAAAMAALIGLAPMTAIAVQPPAGAPSAPTTPAAPTPSGAPLAPGAPLRADQLEAFVDGVVRTAMARDHIAGVEVSVVQDGRIVLAKGYGFAGPGGRPVDPDRTLFRIGSVSKTFTWIAALREVEAGRMALDAPINRYLPPRLAAPDVPGWRQIELRDLMTHSPGFEDRPLDRLFELDPARIRPLASQLVLARPARVFPPGTTPAYSNYGAELAGAAVANLEHASFQTVVEREIIGPLGMAHTTFREPYAPRADLPAPMPAGLAADAATGYRWVSGGFVAEPYEYVTQGAPAGAGSSTAGDMARYMLAMLAGGRLDGQTIYGPATAVALFTPLPRTDAPGDIPMDHGFMRFALPGGFVGHGHDGDTIWFHSGMVMVPDLKLGVFVTTNTNTGERLASELPPLIVGRFYAPPPAAPLPGAPALAKQAAVYAGTYITNRRPFSGLEKFVFLALGQARLTVTPDGRLLTPGLDGWRAWTPAGAAGRFRRVDGPQVTSFQLVGGRARRWYSASGVSSFDRAGPVYALNNLLLVLAASLVAIAATLAGPLIRRGRGLPETGVQRAASRIQVGAALLWLAALVALALFTSGARDQARLLANWPEPAIVIGASAALLAALASWVALGLTAFAWWGDEGWGAWRKLRFSATSILLALLGLQLALWGALEPWAT